MNSIAATLVANPSIYGRNTRREKFSICSEFDFYGLSSIKKFGRQPKFCLAESEFCRFVGEFSGNQLNLLNFGESHRILKPCLTVEDNSQPNKKLLLQIA
jgi:hypothetical protein